MGKGYNNYMCKKPFHPGSKANIKRTWMAEQRTDNEKKKQDDLKVQYEKEQELYNNRALVSTESKDKLELNFMYEAPPGAKRERQKEDDEPEYKFEWQRKYNAPREDFAKGNTEIRDQPFGIPVRNVRCIKCHKWGHINTDKECPLFSQASTSSMPTTSMDPLELMRQMREDGYNLKQSVLGHHLNPQAANQQLLESEEEDPEVEFLQSLTSKQKHKLLKKLNKISKRETKGGSSCNKKKKSKKHKSKRESSEPESEDDQESKRSKIKKIAKRPAQRSLNIGPIDGSDSVDSKEGNLSKQKTKKIVDQRHKNNNSSAGSDSDDDKIKKDREESVTQSCKDEYTGAKSKAAKERQKKSTASKIVGLKHSMKKKTKRDSKDRNSEGSSTHKFSDVEGRIEIDLKENVKLTPSKPKSKKIETDVKEEAKIVPSKHESKRINTNAKEDTEVTPSKHESKRIEAHVQQQVSDAHCKHKSKRNASESSSDSGSSGNESGSPDYQLKRLKLEPNRDLSSTKVEASDSQSQKSTDDGTKASSSKGFVKASVTISSTCVNEVSNSPEHPDRFTCSTPPPLEVETIESSNLATFLLERKYHGDKDEKFRRINRDRRSPSFKQKYRLT